MNSSSFGLGRYLSSADWDIATKTSFMATSDELMGLSQMISSA